MCWCRFCFISCWYRIVQKLHTKHTLITDINGCILSTIWMWDTAHVLSHYFFFGWKVACMLQTTHSVCASDTNRISLPAKHTSLFLPHKLHTCVWLIPRCRRKVFTFLLIPIVLIPTDLLLKRSEGLGQPAHFWWDPHHQSLCRGWVLPVFRWRRSQGPNPPGHPAEEPFQAAPQPQGHRQRGGGGGRRRGPAALCASEWQPQVHYRVMTTHRGRGGCFQQPSLDLEEEMHHHFISWESHLRI